MSSQSPPPSTWPASNTDPQRVTPRGGGRNTPDNTEDEETHDGDHQKQ